MSEDSRVPFLDVLRSLAVLWVVAAHMEGIGWMSQAVVPHAITSFGFAGVDLFFVLSGFLIGGILLKEVDRTQKLRISRFWLRRWLRTLPAYYLTLAIVFGGERALGKSFQNPVAYLVFLQNYSVGFEHFSWSWSLCVEEHFYLVLPIIFSLLMFQFRAAGPRGALRIIAVLGIAISVLSRIYASTKVDLSHAGWDVFQANIYNLTHCRLDGLAVGIFLATLRPKKDPLAAVTTIAGTVIIVACITLNALQHVWFSTHGYLFLALGFGTIIHGSIRCGLRAFDPPGARLVAELSYAIYLVHPLVFRCLRNAVFLPFPVRFAAAAGATFTLAFVMRRYVEVPLLKWRERVAP